MVKKKKDTINEFYKKEDEKEFTEITTFILGEVWGIKAKNYHAKAIKGVDILVTGKLAQKRWEDDNKEKNQCILLT